MKKQKFINDPQLLVNKVKESKDVKMINDKSIGFTYKYKYDIQDKNEFIGGYKKLDIQRMNILTIDNENMEMKEKEKEKEEDMEMKLFDVLTEMNDVCFNVYRKINNQIYIDIVVYYNEHEVCMKFQLSISKENKYFDYIPLEIRIGLCNEDEIFKHELEIPLEDIGLLMKHLLFCRNKYSVK